ncbi:MAG: ABC transporter ATP-binding protein [Bacteroidota bacterium]
MDSPRRPAGIEIRDAVKRFGDVAAVDSVSVDVADGELVSLLGPSGCGKTTLLRLVGGFEAPDSGTISIGGRDVTRLSPQARPTAMVFQSYALFPTMTVGENVAYGLRVRGVSRSDSRQRASRALARVDLSGLDDRPVSALSGGQQQRVALARAIAAEPSVLLFDEPLSNLDLALREATRAEIKTLQKELGTTSLYVTHDQQEALALSDQIVLMRSGRVVGTGAPEALYASPPTAYAARFLGGANVIHDRELAERMAGEPMPEGMALVIRPEHLSLKAASGANSVPGRVIARQFLGMIAEVIVGIGPLRLRAWVDPELEIPESPALHASSCSWARNDDAGSAADA